MSTKLAEALGQQVVVDNRVGVGGNIGRSLLADLPRIDKTHLVVLELSSYMLEYLGAMKWSPHRYAGKFKTPNLIIHNDLDFRVPINQGMELFTALQRQGVPSKLIMFPDEGHWVNKPQNSERWHQEVFAWLKEYLK